MNSKYVLLIGLVALSFAAGWLAHTPAAPKVQEIIQIREVAAVKEADAKRDSHSYSVIKPRKDSAQKNLDLTDTVEVIKYIALSDSTLSACEKALASCHVALRAKNSVIAKQDGAIAAASSPRLFNLAAETLWEFESKYPVTRASLEVRISRHWRIKGEGELSFRQGQGIQRRLLAGLRYEF